MKTVHILKFPLRAYAVLLPAALLFSTATLAAEPETPLPAPAANADVEEIEITGKRTLLTFRMEMQQAEDHMFNLFNSLNSSNKLDLTCEQQTRALSHIKQRSCNRRYIEEARMDEIQLAMFLGIPAKSDLQIWNENAQNHRQFSAELKALAEQHPEMLAAIIDVVEKRKRYAEEQRERSSTGLLGNLVGNED
ncbi:MAG: hypothetical protein V4603_07585 [Pseudomonadota bacterium]